MNTSNTAQQTAATIMQQLGGNKFIAMTGSKNFVYGTDNNGNDFLRMQLIRNQSKSKFLTVTLLPSDTYCMEFVKIDKELNHHYCGKFDNVYCSDLQNLFTMVTGLYTSLGTCNA